MSNRIGRLLVSATVEVSRIFTVCFSVFVFCLLVAAMDYADTDFAKQLVMYLGNISALASLLFVVVYCCIGLTFMALDKIFGFQRGQGFNK